MSVFSRPDAARVKKTITNKSNIFQLSIKIKQTFDQLAFRVDFKLRNLAAPALLCSLEDQISQTIRQ